jgi:protein tyrosine/serine phosphatase
MPLKRSNKSSRKRDPSSILEFKGIKDPSEPILFSYFKFDSQSRFRIIGWLKTLIRRLSLWTCSKLESISFLDRFILKDDLSNFHRVSETLYRGGQPLGQGFYRLKHLGIKTVVNLRAVDTDQFHAEAAGLKYIHISFRPHLPRDLDVLQFLHIMKNTDNHPVYVHCYHGSDRTGMLCAIYRIFFQGWHKDKAIYEMIHGGYGFHVFFQHNLISYLKKLDVEAIKEKAGLT